MTLPKSIHRNLIQVDPWTTVLEAVKLMSAENIGAVVVVEENKLVGIFSERDLMNKVVSLSQSASELQIKEVMTSPVVTLSMDRSISDLIKTMHKQHVRHIPLLDDDGNPVAMVTSRDVLLHQVRHLENENETLAAFLYADGPGG